MLEYMNIKLNSSVRMEFLKLITVEPAMFLQLAGDTLTVVIYQNLFIDKICLTDLKYSKTICDMYADVGKINERDSPQKHMIPIVNEIQQASSRFVLYSSLVENSLPVILVLFLGFWSDAKRRRKPPLLLSLIGKLFRSVGLLLSAWFMEWPTIYLLLLASLPHSIGGNNAVFNMAAFSYIADSSAPRSRTFRLGCAEAIWQLGSPVGYTLGAFLFSRGGYLYVFSAAVLFHLIAVLYTVFLLPEVPQPKAAQYTVGKHGWYGTWDSSFDQGSARRIRFYSEHNRDAMYQTESSNNNPNNESQLILAPSQPYRRYSDHTLEVIPEESVSVQQFVVGAVKSILKKRPNHKRMCLLTLGLIMLFVGLVHHGELSMRYLFTRSKFEWRELQFSSWVIYESVMTVIGLVIVMPIFSQLCKFSDPFIGAFASFGRLSSKLLFALASTAKLLYLGSTVEIPGIMAPLSARSLASKCVQRDERGRVFAFLGCIDAFVPLIAVPLYSLIYSNTLSYAPSAIYYVSSGFYLIIFISFTTLLAAMKLKIIEFSGTDVSSLTVPVVTIHGSNSVPYCYRRTSLA